MGLKEVITGVRKNEWYVLAIEHGYASAYIPPDQKAMTPIIRETVDLFEHRGGRFKAQGLFLDRHRTRSHTETA
jgi:hypothetical protein